MPEITWRKSSYSTQGDGSSCVEIASIPGGVALRESDDPDIVLATTPARLRALLDAVKTGAFDHLAAP
ncbi:DUF397 domain-containing protein [Streptomyces sp. NA02950]|uniref:DUF397 domain-containing protein n=1 Tax=Streptomyces sp. NA02950 TaxID=2742137 RepID=UPI001591FC28|nr:DUF397 domain-containing protein [Streptomyces sp. NA02950]QKV93210.1 DUF397 domain-containing protein [Streptomyces sp. NA02950]